jgi:alpha-glucoside transport system permease protein
MSVVGRLAGRLSRGALGAALTVVALLWLLPTVGLLVASLRTTTDNNRTGWWNALTTPSQLTLQNYRGLFDSGSRIPDALLNTILIAVPTTILVLLVGSMAAYAFSWLRFPGRDWLFLLVVGLLVVPLQVALIPIAQLYGDIGLFGKLPGVILFHVAFGLPFAVFLLRNFFVGIPAELFEAARMDGAGELTLFRRVVLPLGWPALAALAVFQFLWTWNDLLVALIFADRESAPLTVAIMEQSREFGSNIGLVAPAAFLSMIIPLLVFFAFQRAFVQGLLAGVDK